MKTNNNSKASLSLWNRYLAALSYPDYRRFWYSASIAGAGVWGLIVARGALAYQVSDNSSSAVGLVTFAALIPFVIVPPFSGILADKIDRRLLVGFGHATNIIFALILAIIYFFYTTQMWHLVLLSLLSGIARGFQLPAQIALVPNLVGKEDLLNAIALNNVSLQGSRLLGSVVVGGLMLTTWGVGAAFVIAVIMYTLAVFLVSTIKTESKGKIQKGASLWTTISAGLVYSYKNPSVGLMLIFIGFHCSLTMAFESVFPSHVTTHFNVGIEAFANLISLFGAGAIVGVIAVAGIRDNITKGRYLFVTGIGSSLGVLILATAPSIYFGLLGAFIMGLTQAPFMSLSTAYIQSVVPDEIRGRIGSLFTIAALSLMAIANLSYGTLADSFGSQLVLLIPPLIFLVVILLFLVGLKSMRALFLSGFDAFEKA